MISFDKVQQYEMRSGRMAGSLIIGIVGGGGGPGWLRDGSVGEPEGLGREQYGAVRGA